MSVTIRAFLIISAFTSSLSAFAAEPSTRPQPGTLPQPSTRQTAATQPQPGTASLVSVQSIWDRAPHNAFTDLIRWKNHWYCVFRESEAHVGGNGKLRVLKSTDGAAWESAALLAEDGVDLRDPKFSITPDDRLMLVLGGSIYEGKTLKSRQPRVAFSGDGEKWSPVRTILDPGEWLWRVTWHDGVCYGVSYNSAPRSTPTSKPSSSNAPANWPLTLFSSTDGEKFNRVCSLEVPGLPNETTLRFLADGRMVALVRREADDRAGWVGTSQKPFEQWSWKKLPRFVGGPNFIQIPDGRLVAVNRSMTSGSAKTVVSLLDSDKGTLEELLTLPSGGDNSYAGLVWHDGLLWVSYYSSHEQKKTSIYLAKVKL